MKEKHTGVTGGLLAPIPAEWEKPVLRPLPTLPPTQLGGLYSPGEQSHSAPGWGVWRLSPREAGPRLRCQGHRPGLGKSGDRPL